MLTSAVLGMMSSVSSVILQLIGIEICFRIIKKGTVGDISAVPFFTYFICACLWVKYAIMQNITAVFAVNTIASLLQFMYLLVYYSYTVKKAHFFKQFLLCSMLLFVPLLYVKYYQEDEVLAAKHLGLICSLVAVISYGSPLASVKVVIRKQSTECMSFPLVLANLIVAMEWCAYGVSIDDNFVQMSNFIGVILSAIQVSLFIRYPSKTSKEQLV